MYVVNLMYAGSALLASRRLRVRGGFRERSVGLSVGALWHFELFFRFAKSRDIQRFVSTGRGYPEPQRSTTSQTVGWLRSQPANQQMEIAASGLDCRLPAHWPQAPIREARVVMYSCTLLRAATSESRPEQPVSHDLGSSPARNQPRIRQRVHIVPTQQFCAKFTRPPTTTNPSLYNPFPLALLQKIPTTPATLAVRIDAARQPRSPPPDPNARLQTPDWKI